MPTPFRVVLLTSVFSAVFPSSAAVVTPEQVNLLTSVNVTSFDLLDITLVAGQPSVPIPATGTYSSTGWTWNVSTIYRGSLLTLAYTGQYDPVAQTGTWTGSGFYGSKALNGSPM
jgi:hypothetical protein